MLFNSYIFLFIFLPITLIGYYGIRKQLYQQIFLLVSSIVFYCYWSTIYVLLLFFTVIFDFYIARLIDRSKTEFQRKVYLFASVVTNLSILGFFKYYNFFIDSFNGFAQIIGHSSGQLPILNLVLPIGISFYTFQSMCYVIDVYRRTSDAHAKLLSFAGYVTLFPHQISGPLVRHNHIVPQLENSSTYRFHPENFWRGCYFFVFGLAKKMLIADFIAAAVDPLIHNIATASNLEAALAMFGYTVQLYFDFSGYSDMAVGLGLMMNIQFPQNFNSPYKSKSITEFWQRWHISLSSWLKDYLYISLGGNKKGNIKTYRNLILTMAIGGLWHGANWTFVVWGLFHGALLAIEKLFKSLGITLKNRFVKIALVFMLVNIGWIFFRSPNFAVATIWFQKAFFLTPLENAWAMGHVALKHKDRFLASLAIGLCLIFWVKNIWEINFKASTRNALILGFLFVLCLSFMGEKSPFLYFQF